MPIEEMRRGYTPNELAKLLRISPDRIRAWIAAGQLGAVNVAETRSGKPRFVVLPQHLEEFERRRRVAPPVKPPRRRKRIQLVDYYP
jgi:excisionase family DNA binding protein